jgi:hypothetical protein
MQQASPGTPFGTLHVSLPQEMPSTFAAPLPAVSFVSACLLVLLSSPPQAATKLTNATANPTPLRFIGLSSFA